MLKVSVIMPVYNSAVYLPMAIDSVLNQTLKEIELILVDDGSSDNSKEVCQEYVNKDSRIKFFSHQNHGISYARNFGMRQASGEYIAFIDNDDEYDLEILARCYQSAQENQVQLVKFGYKVIEAWHKNPGEARISTFTQTRLGKENFSFKEYQLLKNEGFYNMVWNGFYLREFLEKNNLYFDEKIIRGYEDWIFNYQLFPLCKSFYLMKDVGYIHYQRVDHSTSSKFHKNQLLGCMRACHAEYIMFCKLQDYYNISMEWYKRAMEYYIEYLQLFEKSGCTLTIQEKKKWLIKMMNDPKMSIVGEKESRGGYSTTQKILSSLIAGRRISLILLLAKVYNKYIIYKRKKIK